MATKSGYDLKKKRKKTKPSTSHSLKKRLTKMPNKRVQGKAKK